MNGAMTVRMIELGARAGFSVEQTVLFVLDGVPLPVRPQRPAIETVPRPLKRDQIADLYATTALRQPAIAEMVQTTPGTVSFFLREMRRAGDDRVLRGDAARGLKFPEHAPNEAPMEVGVDVDAATAVPSQLDSIPPAGEEEGGRTDLAPDVSPDGHESLCFEFPEAGPLDQDLLDLLNAEAFARELGVEPDREECAERDAGPSGEIVAASPAPPTVLGVSEKGTVSLQPPASAPALVAADTADRPAGPGDEFEASLASDAGDASSAETVAPPATVSAQAEPVLDLFGSTELTQRAIGAELGIAEHRISVMLKAARAAGDPRVLRGDEVRARLESERRRKDAEARQARKAPSPPPPPVEIVADPAALVRIEDGFIHGPAGSVKSFPLISRVLAMMASGAVVNARDIAKTCEVRSGAAVMNQLIFWREDLAKIGIALIADSDTLDLQLKLI